MLKYWLCEYKTKKQTKYIYIIIYYATFIITNANFEKSFHYEARDLLQRTGWLGTQQRSTWLCFPRTGILGVRHHAFPEYFFNRTIAVIEPKLESRPTVSQSVSITYDVTLNIFIILCICGFTCNMKQWHGPHRKMAESLSRMEPRKER